MRKLFLYMAVASAASFVACIVFLYATSPGKTNNEIYEREDGIRKIQEQEISRTKDPSLGIVPKYKLYAAIDEALRQAQRAGNSTSRIQTLSWTERGSYTDVQGPFGNPRPGSPPPVTSGRMRAMWVDLSDATNKTVWAAGIDGGLWKTTDITASPATWTIINDFFPNLAIGSICQDPTGTKSTMYFGTGEKTFNIDAVQGGGVWKSTDHGVTWALLANTTSFWNVSKIICDNAGNVYVGTLGSGAGLKRSTDGGASWSTITPTVDLGEGTINNTRVADMTYDAASNKLHVFMGYFPNATIREGYVFTTTPATVTSTTWTGATTPFPFINHSVDNCALACSGNTVYATPADLTDEVPIIYKSTDGGVTWAATGATPAYTSGQGWYCLALGVDPANGNNAIVGSLDCYKTINGGTSWSKISTWVGGGATNNYVHADQHAVAWNGSQVLIESDGGIFYSATAGGSFFDRNVNLRLKQFYSVAIHPSSTNYFLAGAQDNGVHQFNGAGLTSSTEIEGGDGMGTAIDQDQSNYQFGAYVFNEYHRSINSGSTWADINFFKGTAGSHSDFGSFVNVWDYDDVNNIIYAGSDAGEFFRWTTPQTTGQGSYYSTTTFAAANAAIIASPTITGSVSAVMVSPYTSNRVWFGTSSAKLMRFDNANTVTGGSAATADISPGLPASGTIGCLNVGTTDNNLITCFANFSAGVNNVWVSTNGGTSWTGIDGNLPDIPVRWAMFFPNDNTKAMIATEMGVYETAAINGASTVWTAESGFPLVRTDMLQYRSSDGTVAAATHGRGLFTAVFPVALPVSLLNFQGRLEGHDAISLDWSTSSEQNSDHFELQKSSDAFNFYSLANIAAAGNSSSTRNYHFTDEQVKELNYYRLKIVDRDGRFTTSRTILVRDPGAKQNVWVLNNPFRNSIGIRFAKLPSQSPIVELINLSGEKLFTKKYSPATEITIDLSGLRLAAGSYILRATTDGQTFTRKLVKQ